MRNIIIVKRLFYVKQEGLLKIESIELEGPRDNDILVENVAVGICHTDVMVCATRFKQDYHYCLAVY